MNERSARALLGVSLSATTGQIKRAYRRLALEAHPDHGGDTASFQQLTEAHRVLLALAPCASRSGAHARTRAGWLLAESRPLSPRQRTVPVVQRSESGSAGNRSLRFGDVLAEKLLAA